jgi:enoyl-CoA hydratase/carnithine racemase
MDFATLEVTADGPRGRLTLNRPHKLNAMSSAMLSELIDAAAWFNSRREVKVVVVDGRGRSFSAGADLDAFWPGGGDPARSLRDAADLGRQMADAVEAMTAVTVARLHGHCVGGAVVLAAACDLRIAASDTSFSIPELDLGIPLAWGGIPRLVREIGPAMTKELVMTCRRFSAGEARDAGLVNRVVDSGALDEAVESVVASLISKSGLTLRITKRHVDGITRQTVGLDRSWADADGFVTATGDAESRQVAAAYLERVRKPQA